MTTIADPTVPPYPFPVERYCIDSGRPVHMISGDRCLSHGAAPIPCTTDVRPAQCEHPRRSPNHPTPTCEECGRAIPARPDAG